MDGRDQGTSLHREAPGGLRIDQLLHWLCLTKSRSLATRACREGRVRLNGQGVRASHEARVGDRIRLQDPTHERPLELELLEVPAGQLSRAQAHACFRVIGTGGARDAP